MCGVVLGLDIGEPAFRYAVTMQANPPANQFFFKRFWND